MSADPPSSLVGRPQRRPSSPLSVGAGRRSGAGRSVWQGCGGCYEKEREMPCIQQHSLLLGQHCNLSARVEKESAGGCMCLDDSEEFLAGRQEKAEMKTM